MPGSVLGNMVRRVEDPDLLTGGARYVGDLELPGVLAAAFVRSPYAHATIRSVERSAARAMPGVLAVLVGDDLGIGPIPPPFGAQNPATARSALASDKARFVGDAVALVIAETLSQAIDAAEAVEVHYDPLEAATGIEHAARPDAPLQFEVLGTNITSGAREPDGVNPFEHADVVVRGRFENQRVAVAPLEGRAIAVIPGGPAEGLLIYAATQMPHRLRDLVCDVFGLEGDAVRVITPWVGGAFGGKIGLAAEEAAIVAAALMLKRPVRWCEDRSENIVGMAGRSQVQYAELGLRRDGEIVGIRARVLGDAGAYAGFGGGLALGPTRMMTPGVYHVDRVHYDGVAVVTNTSPIGAFRGAGRPEAAAQIERLMDIAADELEIDPVELRLRNLISKDEFPYRTTTGMLYDSGDYALALREAVRIAGYEALRRDQAERRNRGDRLQLGIGVAAYVEITAGGPGGEFGAVEIHTDGSATIRVGTAASGQGHATAFSMIVADHLGIPIERIRFIQADTAAVERGGGTGGSRSLQLGGVAVGNAAAAVAVRGRELAAELLEADMADVVVTEEGTVGVAGVPARALSWGELATVAESRGTALAETADFVAPGATFPFGAHVSVVEVDMETGKVRPLRHVAVDDAGRIVNPLLVAGQQHGGIAQGISQALWEEMLYDDLGNPISGNFAAYCIPSAAEICQFEASNTETPTPYNPLGSKGIGESATIGSTPAVQNAVVDALSHLGVRHVDMPCTPERVWRAIEAAKRGEIDDPWREPPDVFATQPERQAPAPSAPEPETV